MFSVYHFMWLGICVALIGGGLAWLIKNKPDLERVLTFACVIAVLSEVIKTISMLQMVPSADGSRMFLYLEMNHLPLHLCSLPIFFIFYVRFAKPGKLRDAVLAFMYPSCTIGAFFALLIPTIFSTSIKVTQAFIHPIGYQFFLFHAMLILLGLYIPLSGQVNLRPKHYLTTLEILGVIAFASIYLNSLEASPIYENGKLLSVEYSPNFFFTYRTPIGIKLTEMWHWYVYLGVLLVLALALIAVFYIPVFIKAKRNKTEI